MNLHLNPPQLLSLYELVVSSLTSPMDAETITALKETKQKLQTLILETLDEKYSSQNETKFTVWSKREKDKIVGLSNDLEKIKTVTPLVKDFKVESHNDDGLVYPPRKEA